MKLQNLASYALHDSQLWDATKYIHVPYVEGKWSPPPFGFFKVNGDAGYIRDFRGLVLVAVAKKVVSVESESPCRALQILFRKFCVSEHP